MKNKKITMYLGITIVAAAVCGCGGAKEQPSAPETQTAGSRIPAGEDGQPDGADPTDENGLSDGDVSPDEGSQTGGDASPNADGQTDGDASPEAAGQSGDPKEEPDGYSGETLYGYIKSIGESSFTVSQVFEDGDGILTAPADGSPDQVIVTVYVSEETQYEMKTVKNSGVNGDSDVETRECTASDLTADASVDIQGYYKEDDFIAEKITLYRFL